MAIYDKIGRAVNSTDSISTQHPEYQDRVNDWRQMRDTWAGQRAVKARTIQYLPATAGMIQDGMSAGGKGLQAYNAYLVRALFHSFVSDAVDTAMGMLWNKPPTFEIPSEMEYLKSKATTGGENILQLLRSINRQQLITGRLGLLTDISSDAAYGQPLPYIATYYTERIINWDAGFEGDSTYERTKLVVLDESGPRRTGDFGWETVEQYRVLRLDPQSGQYTYGVFSDVSDNRANFDPTAMRPVVVRGEPFRHIPWVFVNANSTLSCTVDPPLLGLSDLSLAIYRLEADYRQALYMQTQDTLFTKGFNQNNEIPIRIGAGGHIHAPTKDGDAKWIGVTSEGLPELRTARENDLKLANSKAGELMDASSRARESGTALEMRIGSKTATLNEIAITGGEGLQRALRDVATFMGVKNIESIIVKPNFEFASREFAAMDFKNLVEAKMLGAPFSWEALHKWSVERGGPGKDLSFEQMMKQIEEEGVLDDVLAPKITPKEQAELDLHQQEIDQPAPTGSE